MKKNILKGIVFCIALFQVSLIHAQQKYEVTWNGDTVYNNAIPQFICKKTAKDSIAVYSLRSMDNKLKALLNLRKENNRIKFTGIFAFPNSVEMRYSCMYPEMEIITLLDSYVRNKVFINDMPNLEGLQAYCKERNIVLTQTEKKRNRPAINDSLMAARARADADSQIKFNFYNKGAEPVRIFIGDKPKGGSGRVQIIASNGNLAEHARKTERIFLLDKQGNEVTSISVTDSLKQVVIKSTADGFE